MAERSQDKCISAKRLVAWAFAALLGASAAPAFAAAPVPQTIDFNRDVRPILSDNCYACHGFDKNARKADLRLDTAEGIAAVIEGRHVTVAGKPGESELFARVSSAEPDEVMPPAKSRKKLSPRDVEVLKKWIEQGAKFAGHWAYLPMTRPSVPADDYPGFARNAIDRFTLERMSAAGLKPSAEADRVTLIRRLSFDLVGLPPSRAEVEAFVADKSPDAYERVVDRLLASPHFGERMAVYWLDLVRYADSAGYHSDNPRPVMPYRDYVIKSFNQNKPFDQFTVEQLAGDLLPNATVEQRVGSTYNMLLQSTEEGGAQPKEYIAKYAADRVRNVSTVWMGATVGCAECHDHKFDPYSTEDFYRLAAFFADIQEPAVGRRAGGLAVPDERIEAEIKKLDERAATLQASLDAPDAAALAADLVKWEKTRSTTGTVWTPLEPVKVEIPDVKTTAEPGGTIRVVGKGTPKTRYTITAKTSLKSITGIRLEALPDDAFSAKGSGLSENGNFVLTEFKVSAAKKTEPAKPVKLASALADHAQKDFAVAGAIDGKDDTGWAILPDVAKPHEAVFRPAKPIAGDGETTLTIVMEHRSQYAHHSIGKFRLSVTDQPSPAPCNATPAGVVATLALPADQRSDVQRAELLGYFKTIAPSLQPLRDELTQIEAQKQAAMANMPTTLATVSGKPRDVRILPRGNWLDDSGPIVTPAVPHFLPHEAIDGRRATRLDLAKWIVDPKNPLTARTFTNRMWKLFYGQGLSKILDDLGAQGEWPTHPALLEWLSAEFVEPADKAAKPWDVKHVVRLLVTSGTYRQSSVATPDLREADPYNRLLARQSRFRLDAEFVRDNALAVSGLLVDTVGGRSVHPYQPAGYWFALNFPTREWENDKGDGLYRRGLYTWWQRSFLHPSLLAFDAPTREECTAERPRSNIPQQALTLLNDPTYVEAARAFAERIMTEGGRAPAERIDFAFVAALSRQPTAEERKVLTELLDKHAKDFAADAEAAKKLVTTGARPADAKLNVSELAAWTSVARALLNLHETVTRP